MFQKFFKKSQKATVPKESINHHFILVETPAELIAQEVVRWGEAPWWPAKSTMKFTNLTQGEVKVGTRYQQKVLLPMGPSWEVEVTQLVVGKLIERTFLNGIFRGKETVTIEERSNGTKVDYTMRFHIVGAINNLLWSLHFKRLHDLNIEMILHALKDFVAQKEKKSS